MRRLPRHSRHAPRAARQRSASPFTPLPHIALPRTNNLRPAPGLERERELLLRELHDLVSHQLSTASMQLMATEMSTDSDTLNNAFARTSTSLAQAHCTLRLLADVLQRRPNDGIPSPVFEALPPLAPISATMADTQTELSPLGITVDLSIPTEADELEATTQRTIARIMELVVSSMRWYKATSKGTCAVALTINEDDTTLEFRLRPPKSPKHPQVRAALRAMSHRVTLVGGTLTIQTTTSIMSAVVALPRDARSANLEPVSRVFS